MTRQAGDQGTPVVSPDKYKNIYKLNENIDFLGVKNEDGGIGQRFDPAYLHHREPKEKTTKFYNFVVFSFLFTTFFNIIILLLTPSS